MGEPGAGGTRGRAATVALARWQSAVARRSAESRATIPDLELELEAEAGALAPAAQSRPLSVTAALVRACALALRDQPDANAAYRDGALERYERVNVGVVVAERDLYAIPTLFDADTKAVEELEAELERLRRDAREGSLRAPQASGATFTLWDLGALGIQRAVPLVVPGQAAALAAGAVRERVLVRDGAVRVAHAITLTLAADHRILYGAAAAELLVGIRRRLEQQTGGS